MKTSPTYPTHLITVFALASAIVLTSCGQERSEAMPEAPTATPTSHQQQQQPQQAKYFGNAQFAMPGAPVRK